ncbi:hypothetical protein D3C80_2045940 [compost metagenome]
MSRATSAAGTRGFLKKLPALPSTAGSGSFSLRMLQMAWLTSVAVGWSIPCSVRR